MRACLLFVLLSVAPLAGAATTTSTLPAQPLVEHGRTAQHLNFDLLFDNDSDRALELTGLEVTLRDREGRFFSQRRLDRNGDATTMSLSPSPTTPSTRASSRSRSRCAWRSDNRSRSTKRPPVPCAM